MSPPLAPPVKQDSISPSSIQVDGKIYSAKALSQEHPGGDLFIKAFAGLDASEAFMSYHRRKFPHAKWEHASTGKAVPLKDTSADADFLELCDLVEKVIPTYKSFAPPTYFIKVFLILSFAIGLEAYVHYNKQYVWYLMAPIGWFYALIGLNIQHDANHGSISRNPVVNRLLGLSQNWIGGSALSWIHQHVVQHHIHTNDVHIDPDMEGNDLVRVNPYAPRRIFHLFQHIYLFILICGFGVITVFSALRNLAVGKMKSKMSAMVNGYRFFEMGVTGMFFIRWFVIPCVQTRSLSVLWHIFPMYVVGGAYLAFFFVISHNFVGVHIFDKTKTNKAKESFLYAQVASSSNVGGYWLAMLNGGLNYQIEHHLFPRMSHTHYHKVAPIVREFCAKKNIPYVHFPSISENMFSCVDHLYKLGHEDSPIKFSKAD